MEITYEYIKKYIKDNYKIDFIDGTYGYDAALVFKKKKDEFSIQIFNNFRNQKCIGYDWMDKYRMFGRSGSYLLKNNIDKIIDTIMQDDFKFKKVESRQLTLF